MWGASIANHMVSAMYVSRSTGAYKRRNSISICVLSSNGFDREVLTG